jgi:hypothetical protein
LIQVLREGATRPAESSGGDESVTGDDDTDTEDDGDSDADDRSSGASVGGPSVDTDPGPAEFADEVTSPPTGRPSGATPDDTEDRE